MVNFPRATVAGALTAVSVGLAVSSGVACATTIVAAPQRVPAPPAARAAPPASDASTAIATPAETAPEPTLRLYLAALTGKPYPLARALAYLPQESNYFTDGVYIHHGQVVHDVSPLRVQRPAGQAQNLELAGLWPPDNFFGDPSINLWAFNQRGWSGADQYAMFYERTSKGWRKGPDLNLGPVAAYAGAASGRGRLLTPHVHSDCDDGCTGEPPKWHTSASRFVALTGAKEGLPVDGNHFPATDKRLAGVREFRGAALPGHALVVFDPDRDLVVDMMPCEDAHTQERAIVLPLLEQAHQGQIWIFDRSFCTSNVLFALHRRGAAVVVREHARNPDPTAISSLRRIGRCETGVVFEQQVQIVPADGSEPLKLRRIELHLDTPLKDGGTVLRFLANLPPRAFRAARVANRYRRRWSIEGMFQRLEIALHSEVKSLGYPRAAVLAFGVAIVAYNVLSVLQTAIRTEHSSTPAAHSLSLYYVTQEILGQYRGMMTAIPASGWANHDRMSPAQLAWELRRLAAKVDPTRLSTHRRAPKPRKAKGYVAGSVARRHVATAQILAGIVVG